MGLIYNVTTGKIEYLIDLEGGGGSIDGNVFEIATTTTLEGFTIPNLTAEDITKIYNSFIGGKSTYIKDTNNVYYNIKQVDNLNDNEISVVFDYFDKMIIEFILDTTTDIITKNGTIIGGGSTATLLEIKTLAQKIADKGWACISQEKTLPKTNNPIIYNDIKNKYDNAETGILPITSKTTSFNNNYVANEGEYFYFIKSDGLYKSSSIDLTDATKVDIEEISSNKWSNITGLFMMSNINVICYYAYINGWGTYVAIYDKDWSLQKSLKISGDNSSLVGTANGKLYISTISVEVGGLPYNNIVELEDTITVEPVELINKITGYNKAVYPYNVSLINNNQLAFACKSKTGSNTWDDTVMIMNLVDNTYNCYHNTSGPKTNIVEFGGNLYFATSSNIYKSTDNGANFTSIYTQSVATAQCIRKLEDTFYIFYADSIYSTTDFTTFKLEQSYGVTVGNDYRSAEVVEKGIYISFYSQTNSYFYSEISKIIFTDNINGNEIDYYKSSDGTKIITDLTQTSEISAVKSFSGYFNYFILDTTNEQVGLPFNSNLWTYMYVGDDYIETSFPDGNATRLLPQAEIITVSSATPSFTSSAKLKANANYQCGTITALTLDTSSVDDSQLETTIRFTVGASFEFNYVNAGLKINGSLPTFEEGGEYIILIVNKTIFVSDKIVAGV